VRTLSDSTLACFGCKREGGAMKAFFNCSILLVASIAALLLPTVALAAGGTGVQLEFPLPLNKYGDSHLDSIWAILQHRIAVEPLNLLASFFFLGALVHTFFAPKLLKLAKKWEQSHEEALQRCLAEGRACDRAPVSFRAVLMHYLGEIEAVFGIWVLPLLIVVGLGKGWNVVSDYVNYGVVFNEPIFVVVIMAIAGTKPVLVAAQTFLDKFARLGKNTPGAWWFTILTLAPLLGSLITEPAAMTIAALLLGKQFFVHKPNLKLSYVTVGLLFVNVSIGGTLTNFAAPPVLMVASAWGWTSGFMLSTFGQKAIVSIFLSTGAIWLIFRKDFERLKEASKHTALSETVEAVPPLITLMHLIFLIWAVFNAHSPNMLMLTFIFFIAFVEATNHHQYEFSLRGPLLVGFFLAGLVLHGGFQAWWIGPMLRGLGEYELYFGAMILSAFNDNAAITYLATLVPDLPAELKVAVVAGAVGGGGLTVIANAPNPAGNAILTRYFPDGITPIGLLLGALIPTGITSAVYILLM
jgi:hypothetical protein